MLVICPHCGETIVVNGLGRKSLAMPVIEIYDALQAHHSVTPAAKSLGCSRPYIYKVLKAKGVTPADVIKGLQYSGEDNGKG
jgi:hypothetical protein